MWSDEDMPKDATAVLFEALSDDEDDLEELDLSDFDTRYSFRAT